MSLKLLGEGPPFSKYEEQNSLYSLSTQKVSLGRGEKKQKQKQKQLNSHNVKWNKSPEKIQGAVNMPINISKGSSDNRKTVELCFIMSVDLFIAI